MIRLCMVILVVILSPLSAMGQCQIRPAVRSYQYNHVQHQQYYNNYDYNHNYNYVVIPKVYEVESYKNHYASLDPYYQQSLLADAIVGRLIRLQNDGKVKITPETVKSAVAQEKTEPRAVQGQLMYSSAPGPYQNPDLLKVVTASCAKCHGPTDMYPLVSSDGKLSDISDMAAYKCFALVNSGEMPQKAKALDDTSVKLFYDWAKNARKVKSVSFRRIEDEVRGFNARWAFGNLLYAEPFRSIRSRSSTRS